MILARTKEKKKEKRKKTEKRILDQKRLAVNVRIAEDCSDEVAVISNFNNKLEY